MTDFYEHGDRILVADVDNPGTYIDCGKKDDPAFARWDKTLLKRLAGALQPPPESELRAPTRAEARLVAKGELLGRADVGPTIKHLARSEGATVDKIIAEGLAGMHGAQVQSAVEEEYAKALTATRDVLATVPSEELAKAERTLAVLRDEVAELAAFTREARLVGSDGLVAKQAAMRASDRIRQRVRERRGADLAHLTPEQAAAVLDREADPEHVKDRREEALALKQHAEALERGQSMAAAARFRTAKRAGDVLEAEALKVFPTENAPSAVSKYLQTDEGQQSYDRYLRACKPGLS